MCLNKYAHNLSYLIFHELWSTKLYLTDSVKHIHLVVLRHLVDYIVSSNKYTTACRAVTKNKACAGETDWLNFEHVLTFFLIQLVISIIICPEIFM